MEKGKWEDTRSTDIRSLNSYTTSHDWVETGVYPTFNEYLAGKESNTGSNPLKFSYTTSYIYDGQSSVFGNLIEKLNAGQHVQVVVKNMNMLGTVLTITDVTTYHEEGLKKVYSGASYTFQIMPGQTKTFDFYRSGVYCPYLWFFEFGTNSDAANVQLTFYSDWIKGMPIDKR